VNVEQALRISTTVMKMRNLAAQLGDELEEVGASANQIIMAANISQVLTSLESSLRPITPTDEDVARHPSRPR
jgi:hypothetical protein